MLGPFRQRPFAIQFPLGAASKIFSSVRIQLLSVHSILTPQTFTSFVYHPNNAPVIGKLLNHLCYRPPVTILVRKLSQDEASSLLRFLQDCILLQSTQLIHLDFHSKSSTLFDSFCLNSFMVTPSATYRPSPWAIGILIF